MDGLVVTCAHGIDILLLSYYSTKWNLSEKLQSELMDSSMEGTLSHKELMSEDLDNSI
jgi:hypothetical protein